LSAWPWNPPKWTPLDVNAFVANIPGCEEFGDAFEEESIDGEALLLLNQVCWFRDETELMEYKL
jgi:hypothetical protein